MPNKTEPYSTPSSLPITHIIFDCDGVLLDTEKIYGQVAQTILTRYGHQFTWKVKGRLMGLSAKQVAEIIVEEFKLPITAEEYHVLAYSMEAASFEDSKVMDGVIGLITHLHSHNVPLAVATSSNTDIFAIKTRPHSQLFSKFKVIVNGNDPEVQRSKPAPDIFLAAAKRLGIRVGDDAGAKQLSQVLVFEDSPNGVKAALSAGMRVIWLPDPQLEIASYPELARVERLPSLLAFNPKTYGLPPYLNQ